MKNTKRMRRQDLRERLIKEALERKAEDKSVRRLTPEELKAAMGLPEELLRRNA